MSAGQQCGARAEDGHGGGRVYQPEIRHAHLAAQIPGDLSPLNTSWNRDVPFLLLLFYSSSHDLGRSVRFVRTSHFPL